MGAEQVSWSGHTNLNITWSGGSMTPYPYNVRTDCPQDFLYTFKKPPRPFTVIDLSAPVDYQTVVLRLKPEGGEFEEVGAEFASKAAGTVKLLDHVFATPGVWTAQFVCLDADENELPGYPILFRVVKNVNDLGLDELPQW